jgi:hypothetical protein
MATTVTSSLPSFAAIRIQIASGLKESDHASKAPLPLLFSTPRWPMPSSTGSTLKQTMCTSHTTAISGKGLCTLVADPSQRIVELATGGCSLCGAARPSTLAEYTQPTFEACPYCDNCWTSITSSLFTVVSCAWCAGIKDVTTSNSAQTGAVIRLLGPCRFTPPINMANIGKMLSTSSFNTVTNQKEQLQQQQATKNEKCDSMDVCEPVKENLGASTDSITTATTTTTTSMAPPGMQIGQMIPTSFFT